MRLSADDLISNFFEVYLDGVKSDRYIMADEEQGFCEVYKEFDTVKGHFSTKTLKGKVELKPKPELWKFLMETKRN